MMRRVSASTAIIPRLQCTASGNREVWSAACSQSLPLDRITPPLVPFTLRTRQRDSWRAGSHATSAAQPCTAQPPRGGIRNGVWRWHASAGGESRVDHAAPHAELAAFVAGTALSRWFGPERPLLLDRDRRDTVRPTRRCGRSTGRSSGGPGGSAACTPPDSR
eukprot:scaffold94_cov254-Pinguiococcus_pyrenoidosus.AAC.17